MEVSGRREFLARLGAAIASPLCGATQKDGSMPTTFQEDNWQHLVHLPGAVHFDGDVWFEAAALAAGDTADLSVSYWYRTLSDQSGGYIWAVDPAGNFDNSEIWATLNRPSPALSRAPYIGSDAGVLRLGSGVDASFGAWHHVCYRVFTAAAAGLKYALLMVDRVPVTVVDVDQGDGFLMQIGGLPFSYGGDTFGDNIVGDVFDVWMAFGQAVDFSDTAVLNKFVTPDLKPVPLGNNGELPTGLAPTIFGHGAPLSFLQPNLGTGGSFVRIGLLSATDGPR